MRAFMWGVQQGIEGTTFIVVDGLLIEANIRGGVRGDTHLVVGLDADDARNIALSRTRYLERRGWAYGGQVFTAVVPEVQAVLVRATVAREDFLSTERFMDAMQHEWMVVR